MRILTQAQKWNHPSVRQLMLNERNNDPVEIIRMKARQVVAEERAKGWNGPPFNPEILASLRGISVSESTNLFSAEAQLTPKDGQLLLEFNPDRSVGRRNYSICHEIAHTLFDDCYEMVHQRKSDPRAFDPQKEVEDLCQIAASELLMPHEEFREDLDRLPFNISTLLALTRRYGASREAIGRRMITLGNVPSALVFLSKRLKPTEQRMIANRERSPADFSPKMRILYSVTSDDFPVFIPQDKSVSEDSCTYKLHQTDQIESAVENWDIRDAGDWNIEALGLAAEDEYGPDAPSVLVLVTLD